MILKNNGNEYLKREININPNENNEKNIFEKLMLASTLIKIYSDIYDYSREGYIKPIFSNKIRDYSSNKKKLNICICSIGKNENLYIREFVEYYFKLGIDKIFIYDNNELEGENFNVVLRDYIESKFFEIIDIRGLFAVQIPIYNYCYRKNKDVYDWIGFLDFDDFLFIENKETIKSYLYSKFIFFLNIYIYLSLSCIYLLLKNYFNSVINLFLISIY